MCEVVDISDDEDSFLLERNTGVVPKDESLDYDLPPQSTCPRPGVDDVASSSGTDFRSSFIGMGFAPALVDKAIEEKGEGNAELVLEALFAYSDLQKPKTEVSYDGFSSGHNDSVAANLHAGEERDTLVPSASADSNDIKILCEALQKETASFYSIYVFPSASADWIYVFLYQSFLTFPVQLFVKSMQLLLYEFFSFII